MIKAGIRVTDNLKDILIKELEHNREYGLNQRPIVVRILSNFYSPTNAKHGSTFKVVQALELFYANAVLFRNFP